jgi:hypothetical protein
LGLSWQELTEMPLDPGEESSLAPLTQMAMEQSKTTAEALLSLFDPNSKALAIAGAFYFFNQPNKPSISLQYLAPLSTKSINS